MRRRQPDRQRRTGRTRRLTRATATRLLDEVRVRMRALNEDAYYLYKVDQAIVFGSYLDEALDRIGDLNIGIRFSPKISDSDEFERLSEERSAFAKREFKSYFKYLYWPLEESMRFLRGGSKAIRLHDMAHHEKVLAGEPQRVVFP